ncbi:hypothetical protein [Flavobacterium sp.]|uniref:hypothetical protein n=1 Tax=Flavobacterium sp. TaxID=239 RepID=UPI0035275E95
MKKTILFLSVLSFGLVTVSCSTDEYDLQEKSIEMERTQTLKGVNQLNVITAEQIEYTATTAVPTNDATQGNPVSPGTKKD